MAAIGANSAPDTFRDRSVHIELQRRPKSEGAKVRLRREESLFAGVRQQLARWAEDVHEKLGNPDEIWPLHVETADLALARGDEAAARRSLNIAARILRDLSLHFPAGDRRELFLARSDRRAVLDRLLGPGSA